MLTPSEIKTLTDLNKEEAALAGIDPKNPEEMAIVSRLRKEIHDYKMDIARHADRRAEHGRRIFDKRAADRAKLVIVPTV